MTKIKPTVIIYLLIIFLMQIIYALSLPFIAQDIADKGIILLKSLLLIFGILNFISSFQIQPFQLNAPFPDTLIHIIPFNSYIIITLLAVFIIWVIKTYRSITRNNFW